MSKRICQLITIIFSLNCLPYISFAQSEAGALFLSLLPGARANAMGGAQTAIANDIYAMYYNTAGILKANTGMAGFFQTHIVSNTQTHTYWGAVYRTKAGTFGFSLNNWSFTGDLQKSIGRAYKFTFARQLGKNWAVGAGFKIVTQKFEIFDETISSSPWAFDFGTIVENLFPKATVLLQSNIIHNRRAKSNRKHSQGFSLGLHLQNAGPAQFEYLLPSQKDPLPQMLRLGIGYQAIDGDFVQFLLAFDLMKRLVRRHEDGGSDNFAKAWLSAWDDGFDSIYFGAEMSFLGLFAFRIGQQRIYNISYANSDDEITYGFGIGPEFARVNLVRRGFPLGLKAKWVLDFLVSY